jgi:signal peptidase I
MTGEEHSLRAAFHRADAVSDTVALRIPTGRFRPQRNPLKTTAEWIVVILLAVSVALLVRHFVVQSYSIPSASMHPTLKVSDRLLVTKVNYQWADIKRGDVIVFKKPDSMKAAEGPGGIDDLVKRVIGLPGDTVEARDGSVFVNGTKLDEPYLPAGTQTTNLRTAVVPVDEYFMMGDNRDVSFDSRFWGAIKRADVIGKVFFRFWPPGRVGRVD